jgi:uncharacterized protein (DUF952 family)
MQPIYHLITPAAWAHAPAGPLRADSLATEGFIHCSYSTQVARVANLFLGHEAELLALEIDPSRLTSPVREEAASDGEQFPHVYGSIDRAAITDVKRLRRDGNGTWSFP